jgi:hypothetical protein
LLCAGIGSLVTSSLCTTTRSFSSSGSTSNDIAAIERCVNETSRRERTRTAPPVGDSHSTSRVSIPVRKSSRRSCRRSTP